LTRRGVAGIDPNPAVVAVAQSRVPGADIRVGSAENLPFADRSFDAALAQLVINLVDDPQAALREMARVTRPGGILAAGFWDDEEMPLLRSFWDAARTAAPAELAGVEVQAQVGFSDLDVIIDWWEGANWREIEYGDLRSARGIATSTTSGRLSPMGLGTPGPSTSASTVHSNSGCATTLGGDSESPRANSS
jgi:SAM-dependent methyltransferase